MKEMNETRADCKVIDTITWQSAFVTILIVCLATLFIILWEFSRKLDEQKDKNTALVHQMNALQNQLDELNSSLTQRARHNSVL